MAMAAAKVLEFWTLEMPNNAVKVRQPLPASSTAKAV